MGDGLSVVGRSLYEAGTLKNTKRTGWWMTGVRDPESVAEYSWRASLIATIIAKLEGADPAQAVFLAVWHDTQETRRGRELRREKSTHRPATRRTSLPIRRRTCPRHWYWRSVS